MVRNTVRKDTRSIGGKMLKQEAWRRQKKRLLDVVKEGMK